MDHNVVTRYVIFWITLSSAIRSLSISTYLRISSFCTVHLWVIWGWINRNWMHFFLSFSIYCLVAGFRYFFLLLNQLWNIAWFSNRKKATFVSMCIWWKHIISDLDLCYKQERFFVWKVSHSFTKRIIYLLNRQLIDDIVYSTMLCSIGCNYKVILEVKKKVQQSYLIYSILWRYKYST